MLTIGVLCGRAIDAGYLRINLSTGIATTVFGMMMVSVCHEYWQFVLAQGVVAGLGSGATFIPSVTVVGTYFSTRRSLAIGIATTGSSVGMYFILPSFLAMIGPNVVFPRRDNIPDCTAKTHYRNRFWMGSSHDGFHHACDLTALFICDEVSSTPKKIRTGGRLQCLPGSCIFYLLAL